MRLLLGTLACDPRCRSGIGDRPSSPRSRWFLAAHRESSRLRLPGCHLSDGPRRSVRRVRAAEQRLPRRKHCYAQPGGAAARPDSLDRSMGQPERHASSADTPVHPSSSRREVFALICPGPRNTRDCWHPSASTGAPSTTSMPIRRFLTTAFFRNWRGSRMCFVPGECSCRCQSISAAQRSWEFGQL